MKKKLLCCIVATVTTLAAVLSLGNASGPVVGNAASTETVDEYLLENGFSQNFIEATDEYTKNEIYEKNGVFESDSSTAPMPLLEQGEDWLHFTSFLTVIDIPEEPTDNEWISHKELVFNWEYDSTDTTNFPMNVYSDAISIYWSGGYQLLPQTATLNVRGLAKKYDSNVRETSNPFEQLPPDYLNDIAFYNVYGSNAITDYNLGSGVACRFSFPEYNTFRMYYGKYWGDYVFELNQYKGTYSIEIIQAFEPDVPNRYCSAIGNYYRWKRNTTVDFSFEIGTSGVSVIIAPKNEDHLDKSSDKVVTFRYF